MARRRTVSHRRASSRRRKSGEKLVPKILVLVGFVLIIVFFFGDHGIYKLYEKKREKKQLLEEIDQLRAEQQKLLDEKDRLKNDIEYIEKIARERYRMAKPGEKVFKVIEKKEE